MLELRNISLKWFSSKEKPFIKNLNIKVNNGKILTIFGSSGIGKSSLINVIAGVYESNLLFTGDIFLNNKNKLLVKYSFRGYFSINYPWIMI